MKSEQDREQVVAQLLDGHARAAMLGSFDPTSLLDPRDESQLAALLRLAPDCIEVEAGTNPLWMLKPDARVEALERLRNDGKLLEFAANAHPAEADRLGRFIGLVLQDKQPSMQSLGIDDLGALRTALQLTGTISAISLGSVDIDIMLSRRDSEQATRVLLPHPLTGRSNQLRKLSRFVFDNIVDRGGGIMWISGVGGSGKSALLAEFSRKLRGKNWDGTPVIHIDFDRPAFYRGTPSTLMLDLSRQLGLFSSEMVSALSVFRRMVRSGDSHEYGVSYDRNSIRDKEILSAWRRCMEQHLPIRKEVVLILDTVEEIHSSDSMGIESLLLWLQQLRWEGGFEKLRPIISGRAFDANVDVQNQKDNVIALGGLAPSDARRLLRRILKSMGAEENLPLKQLVEMVGGNPLVLKILASYLAEGGLRAAQELLHDRKEFDSRFSQIFLYKRILGRVRSQEPDLVKLANPGLVLRRVTADLIENVLAGPCGLGVIDASRAETMFSLLTRQVWLVQATSNKNVVVHRRDLRRLMLQAMTASVESEAKAIHELAADYYRAGRDPWMTGAEQAMECLYHRVFSGNAEMPSIKHIPEFVRSIGEDIETMPIDWRARLKLHSGKRLTDAEESALSEDESALYRSMRERKQSLLLGNSNTSREVPLKISLIEREVMSDSKSMFANVQNAFEKGDIGAVEHYTPFVAEYFSRSFLSHESDTRYADFMHSAIWRCAISTLRQSSKQLPSALLRALDGNKASREIWFQPLYGSSRSGLSVGNACTMLLRLHGAELPAYLPEPYLDKRRLGELQSLRCFQFSERQPKQEFEVPLSLMRDLENDFNNAFSRAGDSNGIQLDKYAMEDMAQRQEAVAHRSSLSLHDLERLRSRVGCVLIMDASRLTRKDRLLLRGLTPEIYPLVRAAARQLPRSMLVEFAREMQSHVYWPIELTGGTIDAALRTDRERWTSTLIDTADRCGMLMSLVEQLEIWNPSRKKEYMLVQAINDYDNRLRDFF